MGFMLPLGSEEAWEKLVVENLLYLKQASFSVLWKDPLSTLSSYLQEAIVCFLACELVRVLQL